MQFFKCGSMAWSIHTFAAILSYFFLQFKTYRTNGVKLSDEMSWILSQTSEQLLEFPFVFLRSIHMIFGMGALHI